MWVLLFKYELNMVRIAYVEQKVLIGFIYFERPHPVS